jgi:hypothetical protein
MKQPKKAAKKRKENRVGRWQQRKERKIELAGSRKRKEQRRRKKKERSIEWAVEQKREKAEKAERRKVAAAWYKTASRNSIFWVLLHFFSSRIFSLVFICRFYFFSLFL